MYMRIYIPNVYINIVVVAVGIFIIVVENDKLIKCYVYLHGFMGKAKLQGKGNL